MESTGASRDQALRFEQNPLLRPADVSPSRPGWIVRLVLNPGVFRHQGRTGLVLRVAETPPQEQGFFTIATREDGAPDGVRLLHFRKDDPAVDASDPRLLRVNGQTYLSVISHLRLAWSDDGRRFVTETKPLLEGLGPLETFGIEDCRVSCIDGRYHLHFCSASECGHGISAASTTNWRDIQRLGMLFPTANKDGALFEEKIDGFYYALHRPSSIPGLGGNDMWLARSPDLIHWGDHRCIARTRAGIWDDHRIGAGGPPIRTDRGWLVVYHGANAHNRYCLGLMLLDLKQPWKVLARGVDPVMQPLAAYERTGFFGNVVFSCGQVVDGDDVTVYYGAADECVCGAKLSLRDLLKTLDRASA